MGVKISPDAKKMVYQRWVSDPAESADGRPAVLEVDQRRVPDRPDPGISDIDQYWWTPDSQEVYYTQNDGNGHSLRLMRIAVAEVHRDRF